MKNVVDENLLHSTLQEEIGVIIESLVSTGKIPGKELRKVQGPQKEVKMEELVRQGQVLNKIQEQLKDSLTRTDSMIKQLQHEINCQMTKDEHIPG